VLGLETPLLRELDPGAVDLWDALFRQLTPAWAGESPWFGWATREFVNRARATYNSQEQPADLIDHLDRLAPVEVPHPVRRRLDTSEIDIPEYR
jgi:hypothetical protein